MHPVFVVALLVSAAVYGVAKAVPRTVDVWRSNTVTWMGRALLLATAAFSAFHLAESAIEIL